MSYDRQVEIDRKRACTIARLSRSLLRLPAQVRSQEGGIPRELASLPSLKVLPALAVYCRKQYH